MSAFVGLMLLLLSGFLPAATARAQDANAVAHVPVDQNLAPDADGLHDPTLEGTRMLQSPKEAFEGLPKASGGNYVNWTQALKSGKVAPRSDRTNVAAKPEVLDLDIVRQVRGYTPPAVFPHAAHSEWIDCPVCHPALFVPKKGANTMTMAEISLGRKCGVCHGTVAFPTAECKRCHYQVSSAIPTIVSSKPSAPSANSKNARPRRKR